MNTNSRNNISSIFIFIFFFVKVPSNSFMNTTEFEALCIGWDFKQNNLPIALSFHDDRFCYYCTKKDKEAIVPALHRLCRVKLWSVKI